MPLGLFQTRALVWKDGAGIDHGRVEEEAIEIVAHIIVEADEVGVASPLVALSLAVARIMPVGHGWASVTGCEQQGQGRPRHGPQV